MWILRTLRPLFQQKSAVGEKDAIAHIWPHAYALISIELLSVIAKSLFSLGWVFALSRAKLGGGKASENDSQLPWFINGPSPRSVIYSLTAHSYYSFDSATSLTFCRMVWV